MEDSASFFNYRRLEPLMFDEILNRVGPRIQKSDTNFRSALEPSLKLARTPRTYRKRGISAKVDVGYIAQSPQKLVDRSKVLARV